METVTANLNKDFWLNLMLEFQTTPAEVLHEYYDEGGHLYFENPCSGANCVVEVHEADTGDRHTFIGRNSLEPFSEYNKPHRGCFIGIDVPNLEALGTRARATTSVWFIDDGSN